MPGRRYIEHHRHDDDKLELQEEKIQDKKDKLVDTLLIITGFLFATSYKYMSTPYLVLVLLFVACSIFMKSTTLIGLRPKFEKRDIHTIVYVSLSIFVSFLFPWILVSVYFTSEPIPNNLHFIWFLSSLVSTALFISFVEFPKNDYETKINILTFTFIVMIALCFLITLIVLISMFGLLILITIINSNIVAVSQIVGIILSILGILFNGMLLIYLTVDTITAHVGPILEPKIMDIANKMGKKKLEIIYVGLIVIEFILLFTWWILFIVTIFPELMNQNTTPEYLIQNLNIVLDNSSCSLQNITCT
jgi:hypothetical protein